MDFLPPASKRQTLLFSATMSRSIRELDSISLDKPEVIRISKQYPSLSFSLFSSSSSSLSLLSLSSLSPLSRLLLHLLLSLLLVFDIYFFFHLLLLLIIINNVTRFDVSPTLRQEYVFMPMRVKHTYLVFLLKQIGKRTTIVFVPSIQYFLLFFFFYYYFYYYFYCFLICIV